jgi:hypothetical protein
MLLNKTENQKETKKGKLINIFSISVSIITIIFIVGIFFVVPFQRSQKYDDALEYFKDEQYQLFNKEYGDLLVQDQDLTLELENELLQILKTNIDTKVTPNIENGVKYFNRAKDELKVVRSIAFQNRIRELNLLIDDYILLNQSYKLIKEEKYNDAFLLANSITYPDNVLMTKVSIFFASNQTYLGGTLFKKIILEKLSIIEAKNELDKYLSLVKDQVQFSYGRDLIVLLMYLGEIDSSNHYVELFNNFYSTEEIKEFNKLIEKTRNYYSSPNVLEIQNKTEKAIVKINVNNTIKPGTLVSPLGLILTDASNLILGQKYEIVFNNTTTSLAQVVSIDPILNAGLLYTTAQIPGYVLLGNSTYAVKNKSVFLNIGLDYELKNINIITPYFFNGKGVFTELDSNLELIPGNPVFDRFGYLIGLTSSEMNQSRNAFKPIYQFKDFLTQVDSATVLKPFIFDWFDKINIESIYYVSQYDGFYYSEYDSFFGLLDSKNKPIFGTYNYGAVQDTFFGEFDYDGQPYFGLYIWDENTQYYGFKIKDGIKNYGELYGTNFAYIGDFSLNFDNQKLKNINGRGYYFTENNNVFLGNHLEDERFGFGETFFYDGSYYQGEYTDTCNADGTYYYVTGQIKVLPYRDCGWG